MFPNFSGNKVVLFDNMRCVSKNKELSKYFCDLYLLFHYWSWIIEFFCSNNMLIIASLYIVLFPVCKCFKWSRVLSLWLFSDWKKMKVLEEQYVLYEFLFHTEEYTDRNLKCCKKRAEEHMNHMQNCEWYQCYKSCRMSVAGDEKPEWSSTSLMIFMLRECMVYFLRKWQK